MQRWQKIGPSTIGRDRPRRGRRPGAAARRMWQRLPLGPELLGCRQLESVRADGGDRHGAGPVWDVSDRRIGARGKRGKIVLTREDVEKFLESVKVGAEGED